MVTLKGQLYFFYLRSRSKGELTRLCCISFDALEQEHLKACPRSVSQSNQKLQAKTYIDLMKSLFDLNPRTAGGLSHLRTAGGGGGWPPPPKRTRKLRKIATSGKRRWIGCGKFCKKYWDHFLIRSNLRSEGHFFSKSGYFRRKSQLSQ